MTEPTLEAVADLRAKARDERINGCPNCANDLDRAADEMQAALLGEHSSTCRALRGEGAEL